MKLKRLLGILIALGVATSASASLRFYETNFLPEKETHQFVVRLDANTRYMLNATSCSGGADYDLEVLNPEGATIAKSSSNDENFDYVRFDSGAHGHYTLKITAYKGENWYTLVLINPYTN